MKPLDRQRMHPLAMEALVIPHQKVDRVRIEVLSLQMQQLSLRKSSLIKSMI